MNRVFFAPLAADAPDAAVADRVRRLTEATLAALRPAPDATIAFRDEPAGRGDARFAGWTGAALDALKGLGHVVSPPSPDGAATGPPVAAAVDDAAEPFVLLDPALGAAEALFVALRVRGHARSGLAGAIRATALVCAAPEGRRALVAGVQPRVERALCGGCGLCVILCGNDGIRHDGHMAAVRPEHCLACGDCLAECATGALKFPDDGSAVLQARVAAYAAGAVRGFLRGGIWLAFLMPAPGRRTVNLARAGDLPDLGVLAATDPVALDLAAAALLEKAAPGALAAASGEGVDPLAAVREAARLGAGSADPPRIVRIG